MIKLIYKGNAEYADSFAYQTKLSAGVDLVSQYGHVIEPGEIVRIETGVYIDQSYIDREQRIDNNTIIWSLDLRMRSSMAFNTKLRFPTAVSTIDADYPKEITVMFENTGIEIERIEQGQRIAQLIQIPTVRLVGVVQKSTTRISGFGSTGKQ